MLKDRSTIDIVIILFSSMVACVVVIATAGIVAMRLLRPDVDISGAGEGVLGIVTTVVGSLIGFIGGRATGRMEANGTTNETHQ